MAKPKRKQRPQPAAQQTLNVQGAQTELPCLHTVETSPTGTAKPAQPNKQHQKRQRRNPAPAQPASAAAATPSSIMTADVAAAAAPPSTAEAKNKDDEVRRLFRSWAWKREHRPDRERFHRPYLHSMTVSDSSSGQPHQLSLSIKQQKFSAEGFASTVWDSSIVVAKYLEKLGQSVLKGKRCLDLSAGCGLVAVVLAKLGAEVIATDLAPNLALLQQNCTTNGVPQVCVHEHRWGSDASGLQGPFDVIVAADVMYVVELVEPLLQSLLALSHTHSTILVAHGRNRPAEPLFKQAAAAHFAVTLVLPAELDEVYQCTDVDVLRLTRLAGSRD